MIEFIEDVLDCHDIPGMNLAVVDNGQEACYTPNAVVELLPHRHCVGATLIAP